MWFLDLTHGYKQGKRRAAKNTEELEGPNADLRSKEEETHGCGRAAEEHRRSLVRVRLMQRPESVKTRGSMVAAAELEWQRGEEEDDWGQDLGRPIYKRRLTERARKMRR